MDVEARVDPPLHAGERESLTAFLDFQRGTMLRKVAGLSKEQLGRVGVPPSGLTLAGLLKHLALVEDSWFQEVFLGRPMPEPWTGVAWEDDDDWDFHSAPRDEPAELVEWYSAAVRRSRDVVAGAESLDQLSVEPIQREGRPFSLRWIVLHLVEQTARHAGHADLLREALDGQTGE